MNNIHNILQWYRIAPSEIRRITDRLYQVQSSHYTFALKRARISQSNMNAWKSVYQMAYQKQLSSIVPVYMTENQEIFVKDNEDIYYLTPWKAQLETDEPEHEIESFYRSIGRIHHQTKKESQVDVTKLKETIDHEKKLLNDYQRKILRYVQKFESRHYMSPFELRVCMQYRDIDQVFKQIEYWYDYYLEEIEEEKQSYTCLCHGNLRQTHAIYQNSDTFLINWERAYVGSPMSDLAIYYYHAFKYHDSYLQQLIHSFPIYEKYNPISPHERSLLAIYLLYPSSYLAVIDRYDKRKSNKPQPFQVQALEQAYRRLMHGLSVQHYLFERREALQQAAVEQDD